MLDAELLQAHIDRDEARDQVERLQSDYNDLVIRFHRAKDALEKIAEIYPGEPSGIIAENVLSQLESRQPATL